MSTLNVLYQSDNNYAMVTGVSIASLCINNSHLADINIYLIDDGISEDNLEKIRKLVCRYNRNLVVVDSSPIKQKLIELNVQPWRGTYTTYYKLFAASQLELPTDRVLQLDGDTIINGKLDELLSLDLSNSVCAATRDCVLTSYKKAIGLKRDEYYYNCGVMLINVDYWKRNNCTGRIIDHLNNVRNKYFVVDQDIVNVLFRNEITYISATYNFNACFYLYGVDRTFSIYDLTDDIYIPKKELKGILETGPVINHCMSAMCGRPWEHDSIHPQNDLFDHYLKLTEWDDSDKLTVRRSFVFRAQRWLYVHLPLSLYWPIHRAVLTFWMWKQNRDCLASVSE